MRHAVFVLAVLGLTACGSAGVKGHATTTVARAAGAAVEVAAPAGGAHVARAGATGPAMAQGTRAAAVRDDYRGTTEPAKRRPCTIQITSEMQRRMGGYTGIDGRPKLRIKEISVPCSSRCPGQRESRPQTRQQVMTAPH
jgi:hypothetical protein